MATEDFEVLMQHVDNVFDAEDCTKSLVLAQKAQSNKSVPFSKIDSGRGILWFDTDNRGLDLGRGLETISANFNQVIHSCQQLHIHRQTTVEVAARFGHQAHCEFTLEHQYGASENWSVLQ